MYSIINSFLYCGRRELELVCFWVQTSPVEIVRSCWTQLCRQLEPYIGKMFLCTTRSAEEHAAMSTPVVPMYEAIGAEFRKDPERQTPIVSEEWPPAYRERPVVQRATKNQVVGCRCRPRCTLVESSAKSLKRATRRTNPSAVKLACAGCFGLGSLTLSANKAVGSRQLRNLFVFTLRHCVDSTVMERPRYHSAKKDYRFHGCIFFL